MTNRGGRSFTRGQDFPGNLMLATGLDAKSDQRLIPPPAVAGRWNLCGPSHSPLGRGLRWHNATNGQGFRLLPTPPHDYLRPHA